MPDILLRRRKQLRAISSARRWLSPTHSFHSQNSDESFTLLSPELPAERAGSSPARRLAFAPVGFLSPGRLLPLSATPHDFVHLQTPKVSAKVGRQLACCSPLAPRTDLASNQTDALPTDPLRHQALRRTGCRPRSCPSLSVSSRARSRPRSCG